MEDYLDNLRLINDLLGIELRRIHNEKEPHLTDEAIKLIDSLKVLNNLIQNFNSIASIQ